jgi:hypothetical protein
MKQASRCFTRSKVLVAHILDSNPAIFRSTARLNLFFHCRERCVHASMLWTAESVLAARCRQQQCCRWRMFLLGQLDLNSFILFNRRKSCASAASSNAALVRDKGAFLFRLTPLSFLIHPSKGSLCCWCAGW